MAEPTRALALTGRGLLAFQLGDHADVDADLRGALDIFRAHGDVASTALTYSFYAEVAAARGEIDEARRRRLEVLDFYRNLPDEPFVHGARAYSEGKIAVLDRDFEAAERWYRHRRGRVLAHRSSDDAHDLPGHDRRLRGARR